MAKIDWIQYTERATGLNHPLRPDVVNRPLRQLLQNSGVSPDEDNIKLLLQGQAYTQAEVDALLAVINADIDTLEAAVTVLQSDVVTLQNADVAINAELDQRGMPAGGTLGQVLKKQSASDYDADWEDESGGGGSAVGGYSPADEAPSSPSLYDDEFENTVLDAKWTIDGDVTAPNTRDIHTSLKSWIRVKCTGGGGTTSFRAHQLYSPGAGVAYSITGKASSIGSANFVGAFIEVFDAADANGFRMGYERRNSDNAFYIDTKTGGGFSFGSSALSALFMGPVYMHIQRDTSTNYFFYISPDGISWRRMFNTSKAFTAERVGINFGGGGATIPNITGFDWFRVNWLFL